MAKPAIALFNSLLLPPSETFIRSQGEGLQQFTPYYVGSRFVNGLSLPLDRALVINHGGLWGKAEEGLFKVLGVAPRLQQQLRQLNPSLIHAHFGLNGALALPLSQSLQVPLIVTFHGADATTEDKYAQRISHTHRTYLRRRGSLKRQVRLFIAVSDFIKGKLLKQGFPADKIVVHYIGVDTNTFQPDLAIPREPVVLFVGRLSEKKGCRYLIQAMARAQAEVPEAELVMIGDGALRAELEQDAAQSLKRYRFLGVQPPEVVKSWMNRAMLLAAPSITAATGDSEGLPIVILEAQAMGLPVVSSIHAGIPEAVIHGETGFLAAERDWQSFAAYITQLFKDPDLWQRLSREGQKRVREHFNLHKQTQILEEIYAAVLQESH